MKDQVGSWGAGFISIGLLDLAARRPARVGAALRRDPAPAGARPRAAEGAGHENAHGAPHVALWLTNFCVQAMLLWTLFNSSTYTKLIYLATSLILLPYLWSAAYQVLLAVRGETYEYGHGRTRTCSSAPSPWRTPCGWSTRAAGSTSWWPGCSTSWAPRSTCGPARRAAAGLHRGREGPGRRGRGAVGRGRDRLHPGLRVGLR